MADVARSKGWVLLLLVSGLTLALVGAGVWFAAVRLDIADQWFGVAGGLAAIIGLPMSVYGTVLARRSAGGDATLDRANDRSRGAGGIYIQRNESSGGTVFAVQDGSQNIYNNSHSERRGESRLIEPDD